MRLPCEITANYILPTVRYIIASELKSRGLSQVNIANKLLTTPASVNQYLKSKRGICCVEEIEENKKTREIIDQIIEELQKEDYSTHKVAELFCDICKVTRSSGIACTIHKSRNPILSERECQICLDLCLEHSCW